MYNYQKYQHEQRLLNKCKQQYEKYMKQNKNRRSKDIQIVAITQSLNKNHKKRLDNFLVSVIQDPIQLKQYKIPKYEPRNLHIGGQNASTKKLQKLFKLKYYDSKSRVQEIVQQNQCLDPIPFKNSSFHKFRQTSLSINKKPFKFMLDHSTGYSGQVFHQLNVKQNCNLVEQKKSIYQHFYDLQKGNAKNNKFQNNKSYSNSSLHPRKVYLNSLRNFLAQHPHIQKKNQQQNEKELNDKHDQQIEKQTGRAIKMKIKPNQEMNRKLMAIQALTKCGFFKQNQLNSIHKSNVKQGA